MAFSLAARPATVYAISIIPSMRSGGRPSDLHRIMNGANREGNFDLPVNDGLFAGGQGAPSAGWPAPTVAVSHCLGG